MNIGVIGTGYVGLVQGVVLAELGQQVICMDVLEQKIELLNKGIVPIYEPGLKEILDRNVKSGRLSFTTDMEYTVRNSEVIFIAVGTPPKEDGSADLSYVLDAVRRIGQFMDGYKVIVNKSTVPIGTGSLVRNEIQDTLNKRNKEYSFDIVSNPEFLREGRAVQDCLHPDRVVIGSESGRAEEKMKEVYQELIKKEIPFVFTDIPTAEMAKYAANSFLAVKISFINEIALLAEKLGANVQSVALAMGLDERIAPKFLQAGPGFGGSCFPKDTNAIVEIAKKHGEELQVIQGAIIANEKQKARMVEKVVRLMNGIHNKTIAILGLSFKPETDDVRDAPSIDIIRGLVGNGAKIKAYCPEGMKEAKWRLEDVSSSITYCTDEYEAVRDADAAVLVTEWRRFKEMSLSEVSSLMKNNYFFDLRNVHADNKMIRQLFKYYGVGRE